MSPLDRRSRLGLFVIVLPATIIAGLLLRNVLSDDTTVEPLARARACDGRPQRCSPRMSRLIKTPLYHEIRYSVGRAQVDVRCTRVYYVLGDYHCQIATESARP
jgi:hypothetical protein